MYDIFYVSKTTGNDLDWKNIKSKYPLAQRLSNIKSYKEIQSRSFTNLRGEICPNRSQTHERPSFPRAF